MLQLLLTPAPVLDFCPGPSHPKWFSGTRTFKKKKKRCTARFAAWFYINKERTVAQISFFSSISHSRIISSMYHALFIFVSIHPEPFLLLIPLYLDLSTSRVSQISSASSAHRFCMVFHGFPTILAIKIWWHFTFILTSTKHIIIIIQWTFILYYGHPQTDIKVNHH